MDNFAWTTKKFFTFSKALKIMKIIKNHQTKDFKPWKNLKKRLKF